MNLNDVSIVVDAAYKTYGYNGQPLKMAYNSSDVFNYIKTIFLYKNLFVKKKKMIKINIYFW